MFGKFTWYAFIIIAAAGLVAFSSGFYHSLQVTWNGGGAGNRVSPLQPVQTEEQASEPAGTSVPVPKNPNQIAVTVMGDSIAYGTGDETGKGFSTYLPQYLGRQTVKEISVENVGINGLRSGQLLEEVQNKNLEPAIIGSDLILVSIGGNDIRSIRSRDALSKEESFKELEAGYLNDLKQIMGMIRKNSSDCYVVFVGLYNPYQESDTAEEDTRFLNTWNTDTQKLIEADPKAIFIPTYDIFKYNVERYVAPDGLHPNSAGYQAISNRIAQAIETIFSE